MAKLHRFDLITPHCFHTSRNSCWLCSCARRDFLGGIRGLTERFSSCFMHTNRGKKIWVYILMLRAGSKKEPRLGLHFTSVDEARPRQSRRGWTSLDSQIHYPIYAKKKTSNDQWRQQFIPSCSHFRQSLEVNLGQRLGVWSRHVTAYSHPCSTATYEMRHEKNVPWHQAVREKNGEGRRGYQQREIRCTGRWSQTRPIRRLGGSVDWRGSTVAAA